MTPFMSPYGRYIVTVVVAVCAASACACSSATEPPGNDAERVDTVSTPRALTDLARGVYLQYQGGLYPDGFNVPPAEHDAEGRRRAAQIQPLDTNGNPSASGRIVLLSIGMSNVTQEFCAGAGYVQCDAWSFMGQAAADPQVDRQRLIIVNGARGGQAAASWTSPASAEYERVRTQGLAPLGLSEHQVQVVWTKMANPQPRASLPATDADALVLTRQLGDILRALRSRYPNIQQVFFSSRTYAGYATTTLNPEPYAYETGFAHKWAIEAQIMQLRGQQPAAHINTGSLDYRTVAPWIAWGPYLWAEGPERPRADGFFWTRDDFASDGTHPSTSGRQKVGQQLLDFFRTSPYTRCWFLAGQSCN